MALSTNAVAPDAPTDSTAIDGTLGLGNDDQEIRNFIASMSPSGASAYDTGWVDCTINPGFASQTTVYKPQIRRIGKSVEMRWGLNNTGLSASAAFNVIQLPGGFAPPIEVHIPVASSNAAQMGSAVIQSNGNVQLKTGASVGAYYMFNSCRWSL